MLWRGGVTLFLGLFFFQTFAEELNDVSTPVGHGAEFDLQMKTGDGKVTIYFVQPPRENTKAVEMFFESPGMLGPIALWQQFHLKKNGNKLEVENGYIHGMPFKTRKLDKEYLQGFDGVQMNQFLISSKEDLKKHFVATERVTVKAGTVEADHYRVENNGQTVDFWIYHKAKPIGLVKIVSTGPKAFHNYSMGLNRLLTGVGRKIDPATALPMDDKTRSYLPKPNSQTPTGMGMF